jgi:DNA-binding NarL/FixJ family response regulator
MAGDAMRKNILIVDDNAAVRKALRSLFETRREFVICGEAVNGKDAIEKARQLAPDLIILDLSMPVMNGLDAARVLAKAMPAVPLLMFTLYADPSLAAEAQAIGIRAVVPKDNMPDLVGHALAAFNSPARTSSSRES